MKKIRKLGIGIASIASAMLIMTNTAFAQAQEEVTSSKNALTPEGNSKLVDSIRDGKKEFLTVQTKDGKYFYIIIDYDANGNKTVHFLNQVDSSDLAPIAKTTDNNNASLANLFGEKKETPKPAPKPEESKPTETMPVETSVSSSTSSKQQAIINNKDKNTSSSGNFIIFLALLGGIVACAIGFGIFLFKKIKKAKEHTDVDIDEYVEDHEDDFIESEDYMDTYTDEELEAEFGEDDTPVLYPGDELFEEERKALNQEDLKVVKVEEEKPSVPEVVIEEERTEPSTETKAPIPTPAPEESKPIEEPKEVSKPEEKTTLSLEEELERAKKEYYAEEAKAKEIEKQLKAQQENANNSKNKLAEKIALMKKQVELAEASLRSLSSGTEEDEEDDDQARKLEKMQSRGLDPEELEK